jgi:hypothetical protein
MGEMGIVCSTVLEISLDSCGLKTNKFTTFLLFMPPNSNVTMIAYLSESHSQPQSMILLSDKDRFENGPSY